MRALTAQLRARSATAAIAVLSALALVAGPAAPAAAERKVPRGFVGIDAGAQLVDRDLDLEREYDLIAGSGAESVRQSFNWQLTQPHATAADVPPEQAGRYRDEDGVPTDWSYIDRQMIAAAQRRLRVLPVVQTAPNWAARHPGSFSSPPRDPDEFARFARAAARRYGPGGTFWSEHPELPARPIRDWQLWNEPSLRDFWSDDPWVEDYVDLVRTTRRAIRAVDPGARIVLAGLPNKSWIDLQRIYREGGRNLFDVVAVHPFTTGVDGVLTIARRNRRVMARNRDSRKPLLMTEISWTSSRGKTNTGFGWEVSERTQARRASHVLDLLARERRKLRLEGVYWFTWFSIDQSRTYSFDYAGLRTLRSDGTLRSKPALAAFRRRALKLAGCRRRAARADRCG